MSQLFGTDGPCGCGEYCMVSFNENIDNWDLKICNLCLQHHYSINH